jgi:osmoprotectant transport system ATP-binding protein
VGSVSDVSEEPAALDIELEHLTKRYRGMAEAAVDDVTMTIPAGELVVFVGPSGCGKTTTMKMINRLIEPTSGTIRLGGEDVTHTDPVQLRRRIGYVIQSIGLFPHMTIEENIAQVPKMLRWNKKRISARVEELLVLVGLDPGVYARRHPRQLSGGQQQRVGVARALAADPPVLLMDEPFGATDPITRVNLQREFRRLQRELGKTVIFVTHDFEEALLLGDKIAVLAERSRIVQYDSALALVGRPADAHVGHFIGSTAHVRLLGLLKAGAAADPTVVADSTTVTVDPEVTLRDVLDHLLGGAAGVSVRAADGSVLGGIDFAAIRDAVTRQLLTDTVTAVGRP